MKEQIFTIKNKMGLHARPASLFVQEAGKFKSKILVSKDAGEINGKSIMGLMLLQAECGAKIKITADGPDENEALEALGKLIAGQFENDNDSH